MLPLSLEFETTDVLIREILLADAAAITAHSEIDLQRLVNRRSFGLTISFRKTEVIGQKTNSRPEKKCEPLKIVDKFVYFGSTVKVTLSMGEQSTSHLGRDVVAFKKLLKRL